MRGELEMMRGLRVHALAQSLDVELSARSRIADLCESIYVCTAGAGACCAHYSQCALHFKQVAIHGVHIASWGA